MALRKTRDFPQDPERFLSPGSFPRLYLRGGWECSPYPELHPGPRAGQTSSLDPDGLVIWWA